MKKTKKNTKKTTKVLQSYSTIQIKNLNRFKTLLYVFVLLNLIIVPIAIYVSNRTNESTNAASYAPPLWSSSFEDNNYAFGAGVSSSGNVSVVNEGHNGGKAVKVLHPANQYYGAAWFPRLSSNLGISPLEDAYFRYYIKPDPNYHFRLEAKIPGLAGNTGNNYFPSGCDATDSNQGWSGRLQWGLGPNYNNQKGRIQTYLYVGSPASNTGGCGFKEEWSSGAELERGKWACIEIRYKMNTVGQNNGVMQGWFNDALKYERTNIRFRNNSNIKTTMMVNQFYHGGTSAWQPIQNQSYLYDKVAISNQRIGCEGSTTSTPPTGSGTSGGNTGGSTGGTSGGSTGGSTGGTTGGSSGGSTGGSTGGGTTTSPSIAQPNSWSNWVPGAKQDGGTPVTRSTSNQLLIQYDKSKSGYLRTQWANYCLTLPATTTKLPKSITFTAKYNPNNFTRVYFYADLSSNKLWSVENTNGVATTKTVTIPLSNNRKFCFGNETKSNMGTSFPDNRYLQISSYSFNF